MEQDLIDEMLENDPALFDLAERLSAAGFREHMLSEQLSHMTNDEERVAAIPAHNKMSSQEISELRKRLGYSQQVFARLLNVSPKTVQAWEQGTREPSGEALKLLAIAN